MQKGRDDDDETREQLPGFRFHPTDEELVGFYLRRKVEKKTMKIDHIIQQIDIYKHDPWDLPKTIDGEDTKELYFFCKRGRKYRNSVRPNRVTGSGFWKATGIDKQVWSSGGASIGLKKTLVYYRGAAGKGTKTDWMMHEFRLPSNNIDSDKGSTQQAEVWTVCRILKRTLPYKKYVSDYRKSSSNPPPIPASTFEPDRLPVHHDCFINFGGAPTVQYYGDNVNDHKYMSGQDVLTSHSPSIETTTSSSTDFIMNTEMEQFPNWDLGYALEFALW